MKRRSYIFPLGIAIFFVVLFFYKTIFFRLLPFPGDLLVSEYKPWRTYSYLGYVPGSVPHKAQYPDTIRQIYPWKTLVIESIKKGQLPKWNPNNFSGSPLLANFQSSALYPLNVIYFFLSQPVAWTILVMVQPLLATFFTYLFCRTLNLSKLASWFAAISFAYGSFMRVWLEYNTIGHVILWLPLILYSIESLRTHLHWKWIALAIVALTATLLAGHPQIAAYIYLFSIIHFILRCRGIKYLGFIAVLFGLPIGIAAIQLLPSIELFLYSARSSHPFPVLFTEILIQPWQLIMSIVPDFFGNPATRTYWLTDTYIGKALSIGFIPLFFLPATLRLQHPLKNIFIAAAIVVLALITANPISFFLYQIPLPIFSSSSPTLMSFLFGFYLSVLTAMGVDGFRQETHTLKKWKKRALQVVGGLLFLWLAIVVIPKIPSLPWGENLTVSIRPMILASGITAITLIAFYGAIAKPRRMTTILVLLLGVHVLDLFIAFHKFNPFSPKEFTMPDTPMTSVLRDIGGIDRFWGYGTAAIEANFSTQLKLYSPDGYDPLYSRWYGEFITSSLDGHIVRQFSSQTRSDARITLGFGKEQFMQNPYRLRVLDALGVAYILDRVENDSTLITFPKDRFSLMYDKDDWKIYRNLKSVPRVALMSDYRIYSSTDEFEKLFFDSSFDPTKTLLLNENVKMTKRDSVWGNVETISYEPNKIILQTETSSDQLLYVSDVYYPGWKAFVDGRLTKIYRANYAFRAIIVPSGSHRISFSFDPDTIRWGIYLSLGSIIVTIVIIVRLMSERYRNS